MTPPAHRDRQPQLRRHEWHSPQIPATTRSPVSDIFLVDPTALVVDWRKNLSRNGEEPPVDQALMDLARDMMPKKGQGDGEEGSSGQLNPILVRPLSDRRLEVIGGFRRMRAALWLKESGTCPDFKVKYIVSRLSDAEAASGQPLREHPA